MKINFKENIIRSVLGGFVVIFPLIKNYSTKTMISTFLVISFGILISGISYNIIKERWNKKQKTGKD